VHQWSAAAYLEDQHQLWLPDIFRDIMLLHRPRESVEDFFVHASYGPVTGKGTLVVDCTPNGRVTVPSLGINTATGKKITVTVNPWSAETLTLYQSLRETPGEPKLLEIGFRSVKIEDGVLGVKRSPYLLQGSQSTRVTPRTRPRRRPKSSARGRATDETTQHQRPSAAAITPHTSITSRCAIWTVCG
jgi:beta-galactosidase